MLLSLPRFLLVRRKILRLYWGEDSQNSVVNTLLSLPRFLLVRRKILRLYWAGAIIILK